VRNCLTFFSLLIVGFREIVSHNIGKKAKTGTSREEGYCLAHRVIILRSQPCSSSLLAVLDDALKPDKRL